jgi:guanylate kinase
MITNEVMFLILAGVSGVGKTTIIQELKNIDKRFIYISPDTTRQLRNGEKDKKHVSLNDLIKAERSGKYLIINQINNIYYATPKDSILEAFEKGSYPILDFPIDKTEVISNFTNNKIFTVYLTPPSLRELNKRLSYDGRDKKGLRFKAASIELAKYYNHEFDHKINIHFISENNKLSLISKSIYEAFLIKLNQR